MPVQLIDGKYQILRQLGRGGMGAVYEATNLETGRRVAVKVILGDKRDKGDRLDEDALQPEMIARFKREAKAAGAVETQHIAQVLDAGRDPATGDPYMVMELLSGEDLKHLIARLGPLAPDLALRIAAQACVGLQAAHAAGIVHRDIKSANLFLARREGGDVVVKIVDFGIAKVVRDGASGDTTDLTSTGALLGSPRYMSPEQARAQGGVGPRSDLWSLGVVLYEMLAGTTPHAEVDSTYGLIMAICSGPAPPVHGRAPWVSPRCAAIVEEALQIDPQNRFASAQEMLEALRLLLPGGTSIQEAMLVPIPAELKETASLPGLHALPSRGSPLGGDAKGAPLGGDAKGPLPGGETARGVSRENRAPASKSLLVPGLALSFALAGGFAAYELSRPAAPAASAQPPAASPSSSAPVPEERRAPPTEERRARLAVEPADVSVEVDGRAAATQDGGVEIVGALGSVHRVRITRGAEEISADVALTMVGAVPSQMALKGPLRPPGGRAPTSAGTGEPGTKPRRVAPATRFE